MDRDRGASGSSSASSSQLPVRIVSPEAPLSSPSSAEIDISRFLIGTWKRNLEWRQFGGTFQHVRTSNTIVLIEEFSRMDAEPNTRFLRWSFGKSFQKSELRFGYEMKFYSPPKSKEVELSWQYSGTVCHGKFLPSSNVAILNFFLRSSAVVVVYRIVDADTIAVSITEVDNKQPPSLQFGTMMRIDPSLYSQSS